MTLQCTAFFGRHFTQSVWSVRVVTTCPGLPRLPPSIPSSCLFVGLPLLPVHWISNSAAFLTQWSVSHLRTVLHQRCRASLNCSSIPSTPASSRNFSFVLCFIGEMCTVLDRYNISIFAEKNCNTVILYLY